MDGIVGVYGLGDRELVNKTFLATGACQHRGKASTGLAIGNRKDIYIYKGLGRIADVIDHHVVRMFQDLEPMAAIGNIGYTKRKIAEKINTEPLEVYPKKASRFKVVLTMDGYLIKEDDLQAELEADYRSRPTTRPKWSARCSTNTSARKGSDSRPAAGWWTGCTAGPPLP